MRQRTDLFNPLSVVVTHDDFDDGACGWMDLTPNFTEPGFTHRPTVLDKSRWGAPMLSTSTYSYVGTGGSMHGTYSLKLATKPVAARYEEKPAVGSFSHAIKRLSMFRPINRLQFEMWYTYTPEQDRHAIGERDIRAFGFLFDIQDHESRWMPGLRYLNSVNGELAQRWQTTSASDVTDVEWAYGREGEWNIRGIDPQWYGRRHADGSADAFKDVPGGDQQLCYNESDDKVNWLYFRLLLDVPNRRYLEFQSMDTVVDLSAAAQPTVTRRYARIGGLVNPILWVENDADRRVFFHLDSALVSID
ncbi:DUF6772 family protein [Jiangella alba]|uniref:Uncharacterized protein n=1 Tax=Jiangella alba TaxID=561176 RepID=A0A1H5PW77_9ACTN|nr:DUF6772 family protein [Jiangella alba]SEF18103.1 hypothetical protein SAMN04488561_6223 [Jiangella alba]